MVHGLARWKKVEQLTGASCASCPGDFTLAVLATLASCARDANNKSPARICKNRTIFEAMHMEGKHFSASNGFVLYQYYEYQQGATAGCRLNGVFSFSGWSYLKVWHVITFMQFHMCLHKMSSRTSMADDSGEFKHSLPPVANISFGTGAVSIAIRSPTKTHL